ncbi:MAG: mechanosensitive ion channel family protein [Syntrophales bacterium]|nr:mechanosensitive ion channel family protein [Syntrophales bacterium]MDD5642484.1 mechanosensitive ion channel family protein [Syntrophales bacterium]
MAKFIQEWLFDPIMGKIIIAVIGLVIIRLIVGGFHRTLHRVKDSQSRYRARKLINVFGYLTAILVLAIAFKDRLGGLTIAFGVAGAGIAFALQEVIASVAGWVALSFGNFYDTGDRVQLGGIKGDVIDIGMLRTTLMEMGEWVKADQYTGRIVRIANSFVFKEPVFNYSADFPFLWDEITVPIMYGSDYEQARRLMFECVQEVVGNYVASARDKWQVVAKKFVLEDTVVEPAVTLNFNDNWIELAVRYVVEAKRRRVTRDKIFTSILEKIAHSEGKIKIASTTMQLVSPHAFEVRLPELKQNQEKKAENGGRQLPEGT